MRAIGQEDRLAEGHARRLITLCQQQERPVFEWRATELRMDGKLALASSEDSGGFILPTFEAGVRTLRVNPDASDLDALLLGETLADAEQGETSCLRLHDWFWRGSAIGFAANLAEPFDRVADFVLAQPIEGGEHWAEVGRVAIERWNDAAWKVGEALSEADIIERYRQPMERYQARVFEGALLLGHADQDALREIADDPKGWAALEMDVLLKHPNLRHTLPEPQLARRVIEMVYAADEVDARLLDLLGLLADGEDEAAAALDDAELGAAVAAKVTEAGMDEDALLDFVDFAGESSVTGLARHLAERAVGEGNALVALACLLRHWGPKRFFMRLADRRLSPVLATGLMKSALDQGVATSLLVEALADLPPATALTVLAAIDGLREKAQPLIERLLVRHPATAGALVQRMLETSAGTRLVGEVLRDSAGEGWNGRMLRRTLEALVSGGLGRDCVLPLYRGRGTAIEVRLAALSVLADDSELRDEVLRRRAADMMEPAEIRAALKEARAR